MTEPTTPKPKPLWKIADHVWTFIDGRWVSVQKISGISLGLAGHQVATGALSFASLMTSLGLLHSPFFAQYAVFFNSIAAFALGPIGGLIFIAVTFPLFLIVGIALDTLLSKLLKPLEYKILNATYRKEKGLKKGEKDDLPEVMFKQQRMLLHTTALVFAFAGLLVGTMIFVPFGLLLGAANPVFLGIPLGIFSVVPALVGGLIGATLMGSLGYAFSLGARYLRPKFVSPITHLLIGMFGVTGAASTVGMFNAFHIVFGIAKTSLAFMSGFAVVVVALYLVHATLSLLLSKFPFDKFSSLLHKISRGKISDDFLGFTKLNTLTNNPAFLNKSRNAANDFLKGYMAQFALMAYLTGAIIGTFGAVTAIAFFGITNPVLAVAIIITAVIGVGALSAATALTMAVISGRSLIRKIVDPKGQNYTSASKVGHVLLGTAFSAGVSAFYAAIAGFAIGGPPGALIGAGLGMLVGGTSGFFGVGFLVSRFYKALPARGGYHTGVTNQETSTKPKMPAEETAQNETPQETQANIFQKRWAAGSTEIKILSASAFLAFAWGLALGFALGTVLGNPLSGLVVGVTLGMSLSPVFAFAGVAIRRTFISVKNKIAQKIKASKETKRPHPEHNMPKPGYDKKHEGQDPQLEEHDHQKLSHGKGFFAKKEEPKKASVENKSPHTSPRPGKDHLQSNGKEDK